jgi:hypothetical protein
MDQPDKTMSFEQGLQFAMKVSIMPTLALVEIMREKSLLTEAEVAKIIRSVAEPLKEIGVDFDRVLQEGLRRETDGQ